MLVATSLLGLFNSPLLSILCEAIYKCTLNHGWHTLLQYTGNRGIDTPYKLYQPESTEQVTKWNASLLIRREERTHVCTRLHTCISSHILYATWKFRQSWKQASFTDSAIGNLSPLLFLLFFIIAIFLKFYWWYSICPNMPVLWWVQWRVQSASFTTS